MSPNNLQRASDLVLADARRTGRYRPRRVLARALRHVRLNDTGWLLVLAYLLEFSALPSTSCTTASKYDPTDLRMVALRLAAAAGMPSPLHTRAVLPSIEELEAEFGGELVQQARHMVHVHNTGNAAAAAALNEGVGVLGIPDVGRAL